MRPGVSRRAQNLGVGPVIQRSSTALNSLRKRRHFGSLFSGSQYHIPYLLVRESAPREGSILDWGCGNGHFSRFLLEEGYDDIHCYSFRPPVLLESLAGIEGRVTIHKAAKAMGSCIPLRSDSFQTVLSIGVLEHVRETGGTKSESLQEILRILKPEGRLICCHLPNRRSPLEALSRLIPGRYHHQYLFSRNQIVELVETAGFEVESMLVVWDSSEKSLLRPSALAGEQWLCVWRPGVPRPVALAAAESVLSELCVRRPQSCRAPRGSSGSALEPCRLLPK